MKLGGNSVERYTGTVSIVRPVGDGKYESLDIKVKQLPITWQEECELQLPPPKPPVVGKTYDKQGNESPKYDRDDPEFKRACATWEHRTWAKKIHDATIDDRIEWETDRGDLSPSEFYDRIFGELLESFSRSEVAQWVFTINAIDQVAGVDVAFAKESLHRVVIGDGEAGALGEVEVNLVEE